MYPVSERFHQLANQPAPRTRCRIYFIPDTVDCTDDADVVANGTLLVRESSDTDSGRRISGYGGVVFSDLFNTDTNIMVGATVSKPVQLTLLNMDNALSGFAFGRCKIFIDLYDPDAGEWLPCPMGVYIIDSPSKQNARVVIASGYDQMQYLDKVADAWWNNLGWDSGVTVSDLISGIASEVGVSLNTSISDRILNASHEYTKAPFQARETTFRDILAYLGGVTGTIAYFDRDGALDMRWFTYAVRNGRTFYYNTDYPGNGCMGINIADYAVTPIDMLQILAVDPALNTSVGSGANVYQIAGNPFITGEDTAEVNTLVTPIYDRLKTVVPFNPMTVSLACDWSIEAGDVIYVITSNEGVLLPVMQQTMTWRGGNVVSEMNSSGDQTRRAMTEEERSVYSNAVTMHEFENTAAQLRSLIYDLSGNFTLIQQTVDSITQAVSGQGNLIQSILDPTGQIWTAIKTNSTDLTNLEDALNSEISDRKSYIRFLPLEPSIVLGVDTGNEIKLKLVNNVIYFFNGDDDSTDLSLAYAYFNSEEGGADRFVAKESLQIGNADSQARWLLKELSNGDLVLDLV